MEASNYPAGAEFDPYCPWNASEASDDDFDPSTEDDEQEESDADAL